MHFRTNNCQVSLDSDPALQYLYNVFIESWKNENEVFRAVLPNVVVEIFK